MNAIAPDIIEKAIQILAEDGAAPEVLREQIVALAPDAPTAERLIVWIPEAFGAVALSQLGNITLPTTFGVQDKRGNWCSVRFSEEPLFGAAVEAAQQFFKTGPRDAFVRMASRSTMAIAANAIVESGTPIEQVILPGPVFYRLPAEVYLPRLRSFWGRWFG